MFVYTDRGHLRHALETGPRGEERGSDGVKRAVMGEKREGIRRRRTSIHDMFSCCISYIL